MLRTDADPGIGLQLIGTVQRKPGRGDTTLSVSCSDKIARWNIVGVQGFELYLFSKVLLLRWEPHFRWLFPS